MSDQNIQTEVWKDIPGYEGLYQASNVGRVKTFRRQGVSKDMVMKQHVNEWGYPQIMLCKNSKQKSYHTHRLIAKAFIPNPDNLPQVNHIDCIKTNNTISNLEWCTGSENMRHAAKNGLIKISEVQRKNISENNIKRLKKSLAILDTLNKTSTVYNSVNEAADALGCHASTISKCFERKCLLRKRYKPAFV